MISQVLIVDTETTALNREHGQVIEVGAILYSVKHRIVVQQASTLLPALANPAELKNRIPPAPLTELEEAIALEGLEAIFQMARRAEVAVAHNAEFDRKWFGHPSGTGSLTLPLLVNAKNQPLGWVCTCSDFEWPNQARPGQSLLELAVAHDVPVFASHRALTDCQLIAALFNRMDDLEGMFAKAMRPKARFIADVSFQHKDLAKEAGFRWHPNTRTWERTMAVEDVVNLPFKVKLSAVEDLSLAPMD